MENILSVKDLIFLYENVNFLYSVIVELVIAVIIIAYVNSLQLKHGLMG